MCTKIDHVQGSIKLSRKTLWEKQSGVQLRTKLRGYEEIDSNDEYKDECENEAQYKSASKNRYEDLDDDYESHDMNGGDMWDKGDKREDSMNSDLHEAADSNLSSLSNRQLRDMLRDAGLSVTGKKSRLIKRLANLK